MTFKEALEIMPRDDRFRATVYAMNTLLQKKGIYTPHEFEHHIVEWATTRYRPNNGNDVLAKVLAAVSWEFNLAPEDIIAPGNRNAQARQAAMYLMRTLTKHSLPQLAAIFHKTNHTTVLYGIDAVEQRRRENPRLNRFLEDIIEELTPKEKIAR